MCLGDVCDPDSGASVFAVLETLVEVCEALSRAGIPSVWLSGNHDVCEDGSGTSTLEPLKPLAVVLDRPGVYARPCSRRGSGPLTKHDETLRILALPFTPLSHRYDPLKIIKAIPPTDKAPDIVIGHLNVKGAQPGDEESMPRGREVWLPVAEIRKRWPLVTILNGHIHRRQITEDGVIIPGSIERLRFDEEHNHPGYLEVTL
jgi:DNA repair exonuclease SbcCD nuclease subunit